MQEKEYNKNILYEKVNQENMVPFQEYKGDSIYAKHNLI